MFCPEDHHSDCRKALVHGVPDLGVAHPLVKSQDKRNSVLCRQMDQLLPNPPLIFFAQNLG